MQLYACQWRLRARDAKSIPTESCPRPFPWEGKDEAQTTSQHGSCPCMGGQEPGREGVRPER